MARTRTLANLRTAVEQRADIPTAASSGTRFTTGELLDYINQSIRRFAGMLIAEYGQNYFRKSETIATVVDQRPYALAADHFQSINFLITLGGVRYELERTPTSAIDRETDGTSWSSSVVPTYRLLGSNVEFDPVPKAVHSITHYYVPTLLVFNSGGTAIADLSSDTDYMDGYNGWEEWVINDAAIKCKLKDEEPITELLAINNQIAQEIRAHAANRDQGSSERVRNTYDTSRQRRGIGRGFGWYR